MITRLRLELDCTTAAFAESPEYEIARIMSTLVDDILREGASPQTLRDFNGNDVGKLDVFWLEEVKTG